MALGAITLLIASAIHFGLTIPIGSTTIRDSFPGAAIPEAVLGAILLVGATLVMTGFGAWWLAGIITTSLAVLGVIFGLSITIGGGHRTGDVAYHVGLLAVLLLASVLLLRLRRPQQTAA